MWSRAWLWSFILNITGDKPGSARQARLVIFCSLWNVAKICGCAIVGMLWVGTGSRLETLEFETFFQSRVSTRLFFSLGKSLENGKRTQKCTKLQEISVCNWFSINEVALLYEAIWLLKKSRKSRSLGETFPSSLESRRDFYFREKFSP